MDCEKQTSAKSIFLTLKRTSYKKQRQRQKAETGTLIFVTLHLVNLNLHLNFHVKLKTFWCRVRADSPKWSGSTPPEMIPIQKNPVKRRDKPYVFKTSSGEQPPTFQFTS